MNRPLLVIDQGTTSSRAILFGQDLRILGMARHEVPQQFPASGWVEHDPEAIWSSVLEVAREALHATKTAPDAVAAIGIANQRETVVVWDRATGQPIYNAIVWQDRRTADHCERLRAAGEEPLIAERTGLLIDPYFSATKIAWILDNVPNARSRAEAGELACGTIDSFLIWRLTDGRVHATDATNASRTQLLNIHTGAWDEGLLHLFGVPAALLPKVYDSAGDFGETAARLLGAAIPVRGVAGDQQAALVGQACFAPGMTKATYGTGCFMLLNTGAQAVASRHRLLTTIAYQLDGRRTYALEGSIFIAGAALQWLRDELGILTKVESADAMTLKATPDPDLYIVPAFVGLGAPDWRPDARGAIFGLTRATGPNELVRAMLESVCFQTRDLIEAMVSETATADWPVRLRVDGGMSASNWMLQALADTLDITIERPQVREATALGAAWLARRAMSGLADDDFWRSDRVFSAQPNSRMNSARIRGWRKAVAAVISLTES